MFIAYVATLRTALWRAAYRDDMLKGLADKMLIEIYALHNAYYIISSKHDRELPGQKDGTLCRRQSR